MSLKGFDVVWVAMPKAMLAAELPDDWESLEDGRFHLGKLFGCGMARYGDQGYYLGMF
jgi:hypothetical protein